MAGSIKHKVEASLRDTLSGDFYKYCYEFESYDSPELIPGRVQFMWLEGNYSCDCNRADFLYGWQDERPCSDGKIELLELTLNGEKLDITEA
jgi:hypothetical protein